ncbi:hypothetical protein JFL47_02650, partial [Haemophilus haemoglobinophilus]|nr:hypothetical protein [Canicola haemoglobinophilus]
GKGPGFTADEVAEINQLIGAYNTAKQDAQAKVNATNGLPEHKTFADELKTFGDLVAPAVNDQNKNGILDTDDAEINRLLGIARDKMADARRIKTEAEADRVSKAEQDAIIEANNAIREAKQAVQNKLDQVRDDSPDSAGKKQFAIELGKISEVEVPEVTMDFIRENTPSALHTDERSEFGGYFPGNVEWGMSTSKSLSYYRDNKNGDWTVRGLAQNPDYPGKTVKVDYVGNGDAKLTVSGGIGIYSMPRRGDSAGFVLDTKDGNDLLIAGRGLGKGNGGHAYPDRSSIIRTKGGDDVIIVGVSDGEFYAGRDRNTGEIVSGRSNKGAPSNVDAYDFTAFHNAGGADARYISGMKELNMGAGNDTLLVNNDGNTSVLHSIIKLESGDDIMQAVGEVNTSTIYAGSGNDKLRLGWMKASTVELNEGDDTIVVGDMFNTARIHGGTGNDHITANVVKSDAFIYSNEGDDTVVVNTLHGGGHISTGTGNDNVTITEGLIATYYWGYYKGHKDYNAWTVDVELGDGNDTLTVLKNGFGGERVTGNNTVLAHGNGGLDTLVYEGRDFNYSNIRGFETIKLKAGNLTLSAGELRNDAELERVDGKKIVKVQLDGTNSRVHHSGFQDSGRDQHEDGYSYDVYTSGSDLELWVSYSHI